MLKRRKGRSGTRSISDIMFVIVTFREYSPCALLHVEERVRWLRVKGGREISEGRLTRIKM